MLLNLTEEALSCVWGGGGVLACAEGKNEDEVVREDRASSCVWCYVPASVYLPYTILSQCIS